MPRSTKIVATLGPASSDPVVLERMIRAGVDVVRLNFSHGTAADHEQRAALVKSIASKTGRTGSNATSIRELEPKRKCPQGHADGLLPYRNMQPGGNAA